MELDLNMLLRMPLWPPVITDSHPVGAFTARQVPACPPSLLRKASIF
jgi:hypothetical protein